MAAAADGDMKMDKRTEDAIQHIAGSPEGRIFVEFLRQQLEIDRDSLVMNNIPEQTERLQGAARRMKEVVSLFDRK